LNDSCIKPQTSLRKIFSLTILARLIHDTSIRMVYPFLPEIAKGLGVPLEQAGAMISLRSGVGILSPAFSRLSDRVGHRRSMSLALIILAIGLGIVGGTQGTFVPTIGFVLAGIGTAIYVPTLQAYISERVPYARRGRALGAIEMTWAISGMVGVPLMGGLIESMGWRAPFVGLAAATLICAALTLLLPETIAAQRAQVEPFKWASILQQRSALMFLLVWLLVFFAFENIQVGYGHWFETQFDLTTDQRGLAQTLFGVFEIIASAGSSAFLDRIGKKRGVTGGLIAVLLGYVLLATIGAINLWLALASMSIAFLGFEFSVVSGIPIMSEQLPQARGTMLALGVTMSGLGRMIADVTGSALTASVGFTFAAFVSAIFALITLAIFGWGVQDRAEQRS
jgi:predicted MFS family arabinose efflux permease